jgi:hypothetical protein
MFFSALEQELSAPPAGAGTNGASVGAPGPAAEAQDAATVEQRVYPGARTPSRESPDEIRWFTRGLLAGFLLSVFSFKLGERRGRR